MGRSRSMKGDASVLEPLLERLWVAVLAGNDASADTGFCGTTEAGRGQASSMKLVQDTMLFWSNPSRFLQHGDCFLRTSRACTMFNPKPAVGNGTIVPPTGIPIGIRIHGTRGVGETEFSRQFLRHSLHVKFPFIIKAHPENERFRGNDENRCRRR